MVLKNCQEVFHLFIFHYQCLWNSAWCHSSRLSPPYDTGNFTWPIWWLIETQHLIRLIVIGPDNFLNLVQLLIIFNFLHLNYMFGLLVRSGWAYLVFLIGAIVVTSIRCRPPLVAVWMLSLGVWLFFQFECVEFRGQSWGQEWLVTDTSSRQWLGNFSIQTCQIHTWNWDFILGQWHSYVGENRDGKLAQWRCEGDKVKWGLHELQAQDRSWDITRYVRNNTINKE